MKGGLFGLSTARGRPRTVTLTEDQKRELAAIYLATNRTRTDGSMPMAWTLFAAGKAELAHLVQDNMPVGSIPTAAVEAMRKAKSLVGLHRGGARRMRSEGAYVPGTMRLHDSGERRLMAGEQFSVDDATRNVACWIPWPWGGCKCSDKFKVRLGRWQTLVVHDDASGYVPAYSSVFRWSQSYRGVDAASVIFQTERDVAMPLRWVLEGGVWQGGRVMEICGDRFLDAKGRPNQKLVEGWFGRAWTRMSVQPGDVGRHRGEMKAVSELYIKCREGRADPRLHFMEFRVANDLFSEAVEWLNAKRIDSRTYGQWVPRERWMADMEENPVAKRTEEDAWMVSPVCEGRVVHRQGVRVREDGPHGVRMDWLFQAPWLHEYEKRRVSVYFDPMGAWPLRAAITLEGKKQLLGYAECVNPIGESRDRATEMAKAIRATMMTEYRSIVDGQISTSVRAPHGTLTMQRTAGEKPAEAPPEAPAPTRAETPIMPMPQRGGVPNFATAQDTSESLRRRAAKAAEATPHW
jgi:hypothetical protein